MAKTCDNCGDDLQPDRDKDAGGWYRDKCFPCIRETAREIRPDGGWSYTNRRIHRIEVVDAEGGRRKASEVDSDSELYGLGSNDLDAVGHLLDLLRNSGGDGDA